MRRIAIALLLCVVGCCQTAYVRVRVVCLQPVTGSLEVETYLCKGDER